METLKDSVITDSQVKQKLRRRQRNEQRLEGCMIVEMESVNGW